MVLVVVVIAGALAFYFLTPWLAVPVTVLAFVTLRAIQFRLANTTMEDDMRELRQYRKYLPYGQRAAINSLPRTGPFFGSIILIGLGYFIPIPAPPEKELLIHLPPLLLGGFGFWYHAPAVGMTRILGFVVPFLCTLIPVAGSLLGFSVFGLR